MVRDTELSKRLLALHYYHISLHLQQNLDGSDFGLVATKPQDVRPDPWNSLVIEWQEPGVGDLSPERSDSCPPEWESGFLLWKQKSALD